jgi:SAM-dependent methyltransferase
VLRHHLGDTILELGAGIGNLSGRLMGRRLQYVATEKDPLYLHSLHNRFLRTPNVSVIKLDPERPEDFAEAGGPFDTVLGVNVLEYAGDPGALIESAYRALRPGGSIVLLAPQGPGLYGTMDKTLGHRRRFSKAELSAMLEKRGFKVQRMVNLNKISTPAWWLYGKILRRTHISKVMLKVFDKTVWIWRRIDGLLPWRGLSLVAVATKE